LLGRTAWWWAHSVRDIREIASSPENMYRLYQTVSEFVASTHDREIDVRPSNQPTNQLVLQA